jgi:hypothetical protein
MQAGNLIETQALEERCPTCGAPPKKRCELSVGGLRQQSHLDRRMIALDKLLADGHQP